MSSKVIFILFLNYVLNSNYETYENDRGYKRDP